MKKNKSLDMELLELDYRAPMSNKSGQWPELRMPALSMGGSPFPKRSSVGGVRRSFAKWTPTSFNEEDFDKLDISELTSMSEMSKKFGLTFEALEKAKKKKESLKRSLADLELSIRTTNCLEAEGITTMPIMTTVEDLMAYTDDDLLEIRNFGETTLKEVRAKLKQGEPLP